MCVLAIAWRAHPRWRLVVAADRDEYHDRTAAPLARWPDAAIIAGRDLRAGGTWLGVAENGRFAAVTNLRGFGGPDPALDSRGGLVADLLTGAGAGQRPSEALMRYNPFHAAVVSADGSFLLSNRPDALVRPLPDGIHALSNGPVDTPWRKTTRLGQALREWLDDPRHLADDLFTALRDKRPPQGSDDDPAAIFIADPVYGTRCSTLVTVDREGAGLIAERRYDRDARVSGETAVCFDWPSG